MPDPAWGARPLGEVCTSERSSHPPEKELHPSAKFCTPMEKSKYDQFNDKIKQFSTKTAFFSYWTVKFSSVFACGGLFQDDWFRLMSSLDAPPLGILTPFPEILTWSQAVNKFFNKLIILLFFQRFCHLAIWKLSVSRGICGCCC